MKKMGGIKLVIVREPHAHLYTMPECDEKLQRLNKYFYCFKIVSNLSCFTFIMGSVSYDC